MLLYSYLYINNNTVSNIITVKYLENTQDPCSDGQVKCVANSTCVREGSTFRCECNLG